MKKKFLIISALQVFPPESGGQLRTTTLAKSLVNLGHEVEVFSLTGRKADYLQSRKSDFSYQQPRLREFVFRGRLFGLLQFLSYRLSIAPFWVIWLAPLIKPRLLNKKIKEADHLILDFPYLYKLSERPFILNTHNAEFELYPIDSWQQRLVRKYELDALSKAQKVLFCHQADQDKFPEIREQLSLKSFLVPNGVNLENFIYNEAIRDKVRQKLGLSEEHAVFLFTGSQYAPNLEAFTFLESFALENKEAMVHSKLVIVVAGTVCKTVSESANFKVLGRVETMSDYFWASDFGLNPVEVGSGTNVKMIEFLAAKLPVLTCAFGARGLELCDGTDAHIFERDTLLSKMREAAQMGVLQRREMASAALQKNMKKVEMKEALLELLEKL